MHGNVWEWCEDYCGDYEKLPRGKNPAQTVKQSGDVRVLRGGSWSNYPQDCRSANRNGSSPGIRFYNGGFRVALSPQD